jgi:transposase
MARKTIDDELVAQWIQLHQRGTSYRSIGKKFDVDYRTVKSRIRKAGEEKEKVHWEAVSRQVNAKYLDEHYRMLLQIAVAILSAIQTNPVTDNHETDINVLLNTRIPYAVQKSAKLLIERGLEERDTDRGEIRDQEAERLGRRLLNALLEHEPPLKTAIEAWEKDWIKFQKKRLELIETITNAFKNAKASDKLADDTSISIVDEALRRNILGEEPCSSRVDVFDDKNVRLTRCSKHREMYAYTGSQQEVEAVRRVYDKTLLQLSNKVRKGPIKNIYHSLMKQAEKVEGLVDHLILVGRPKGHCPLCLN